MTGNSSKAHLAHSDIESDSFEEACVLAFKDSGYYNKNTNSVWGCRLYSNEAEARVAFG